MPLWHFRSDVLKGFYASEVYVSAISHTYAIEQVGVAFDNWSKKYHYDMGYWPLIEDYFNEEGKAQEQLAQKRQALLTEARTRLRFMGSAAILVHS